MILLGVSTRYALYGDELHLRVTVVPVLLRISGDGLYPTPGAVARIAVAVLRTTIWFTFPMKESVTYLVFYFVVCGLLPYLNYRVVLPI